MQWILICECRNGFAGSFSFSSQIPFAVPIFWMGYTPIFDIELCTMSNSELPHNSSGIMHRH
jgi:hypothetical protein